MNTLVRSSIAPILLAFAIVAAVVVPFIVAAATAVNITSGPATGSTSAGPSVTFEFGSGDASSTPTFECSIVSQGDVNSFFNCGSPQTYSLPDGSYRFAVRANGDSSTLSERSFMLGAASTTDTATSTATSTDTGGGSSTPPAGSPTITITSGPSEGATSTTGNISFEFTADNGSTTMCSLNSSAAWLCGSPQTFSLGDGSYSFAIMAGNSSGTSTVTRTFIVASSTAATSSGSGSTSTDTSTSSGGGGGSSTPPPAPTPAPSTGNGNGSIAGGPPAGHTVIPSGGEVLGVSTGGNAVIPTVPTQSNPGVTVTGAGQTAVTTGTQSRAASSATTPVASRTTKSVASNAGSATTPGVPNTGTETDITTQTTPAEDLAVAPTTSTLGAAATTSGTSIPGWVWLVLAGIVLVGIGVWALRQPA